jgi:hypothetical protein
MGLLPLVLNERARIENACCLGQLNADPCGIGNIDRASDVANLYGSALNSVLVLTRISAPISTLPGSIVEREFC